MNSQREGLIRLLEGVIDTHLHIEPDLIERSTDDLSLARQFRDLRWRGFVLKSHYFPTVERAKVVETAVPGVRVMGAVTLNHTVGGFNPVILDVAGRAGARMIWLPTVDALNEAPDRQAARGERHQPFWARIQAEIRAKGLAPAPLSVFDEDGKVREDVRACLALAAEYDMAVATGHLARDEIFAVVTAARDVGVRRIIVTHALFPSEALSIEEQVELADMGAYIEHCYTTFHTGKCAWETLYAAIRAVGPERTLLSSDLGQKSNPAVVDGLLDFTAHLLDAGFTPAEVRRMWVDVPAYLVGEGGG
ncbi:MAG: cytosolic protein [Thermoflavifilum sp.]|nr:cytosolic protein [Thermoflavifilum sp.]MCL6513823.1 cytosolic protein [Alicyclobacillus sp.]